MHSTAMIKPQPRIVRILLFTMLAYGPLYCVVGVAAAQGVAWVLPVGMGRAPLDPELALLFLPAVMLAAFTVLGYAFFRWMKNGLLRWLVLFVSINMIGFVLWFIFLKALGGVSMAVADGVVTNAEFNRQALHETLRMMTVSQMITMPWAALAVMALRRLLPVRQVQVVETGGIDPLGEEKPG